MRIQTYRDLKLPNGRGLVTGDEFVVAAEPVAILGVAGHEPDCGLKTPERPARRQPFGHDFPAGESNVRAERDQQPGLESGALPLRVQSDMHGTELRRVLGDDHNQRTGRRPPLRAWRGGQGDPLGALGADGLIVLEQNPRHQPANGRCPDSDRDG